MRSSTSFALLVLAAAAVPSLTLAAPAPLSQPVYSRQEAAKSLLARQIDDESGALRVPPGFFRPSFSITPNHHGVLARADAAAGDESGAFVQYLVKALPYLGQAVKGVFKSFAGKRDFEENVLRELMARAEAGDQESGAFVQYLIKSLPYLGQVAKGVFKSFTGKREFDELLARDFDENFVRELVTRAEAGDEQSGALLGGLLRGAVSIIGSLFGGNKRELNENFVRELMARAEAGDEESGAFVQYLIKSLPYLGQVAKGVFKSFTGKREFDELLARGIDENFVRELVARAEAGDAESGAFVQYLIKALPYLGQVAKNVFKGFTGKREFDELLARDIDENFVRELVARAEAGDAESGAFVQYLIKALPYLGQVAKNVFKGFAGKREFDEMLLARQEQDSAALQLGQIVGSLLNNHAARSLNELD